MEDLEKKLHDELELKSKKLLETDKKFVSFLIDLSKKHYEQFSESISKEKKDIDLAVYGLANEMFEKIKSYERPIGITMSSSCEKNSPSYFARILGYVNVFSISGKQLDSLDSGVLRVSKSGIDLINNYRSLIGLNNGIQEHNKDVSDKIFETAKKFQNDRDF